MNETAERLLNELISTLRSWNQDLVNARRDYRTSAQKLDDARKAFENNTTATSKWQRGFTIGRYILMALLLIAISLLAIGSIVTGRCSSIGFDDYKVSILCRVDDSEQKR